MNTIKFFFVMVILMPVLWMMFPVFAYYTGAFLTVFMVFWETYYLFDI
jgi:hypothetical protein